MKGKNNSYQPIEFTKINAFENLNEKKLQDIITFTGFYGSEDELRYDLLNYHLIKKDEYNGKICIIYKNKGKYKKASYGMTYKDDLKFFDIEYLKYYLISKAKDIGFLETLSNHYRNHYIEQVNVTIIKKYINSMRMDEVDEETYNELVYALQDLVNRETFEFNRMRYEYNFEKIKYKSLRDLAMFVAYQDKKKKVIEEQNKEIEDFSLEQAIQEQIEEKEEFLTKEEIDSMYEEAVKEEVEEKQTKAKVKKRKKKETLGQLSFKDMGWL
jgi:hypothetical protein